MLINNVDIHKPDSTVGLILYGWVYKIEPRP